MELKRLLRWDEFSVLSVVGEIGVPDELLGGQLYQISLPEAGSTSSKPHEFSVDPGQWTHKADDQSQTSLPTSHDWSHSETPTEPAPSLSSPGRGAWRSLSLPE